jgi:hypothetical protein
MEVEFGNAGEVETNGTGWFIGFSPWSKTEASGLRQMPADLEATGLCVKWFQHKKGDPNGEPKPLSEGRTISILVSQQSEFKIEFSKSSAFEPDQTTTYVLRKHGDFAAWGHGINHRAYGLQSACILTVRWLPKQ